MILSLLLACATPCLDACQKLFGDESGQCAIQIPGKDGEAGRQEVTDACMSHCADAMTESGELGDYRPDRRASGAEEIALENRAQAEAWAECVEETSCEELNDNHCAPVKHFP